MRAWMDELASPQRKAVLDAIRVLRSNNVSTETFLELNSGLDDTIIHSTSQLRPSAAVEKARYVASDAVYFDEAQRHERLNQVTRVSYVSALVDHPEGAVIEYPETAKAKGESVAHRFAIDPDKFIHPKENIQYSLGGVRGGHNDIDCYLLRDFESGKPLPCKKESYTCCSIKNCEYVDHENSPSQERSAAYLREFRNPWPAEREVFCKTLALFTALQLQGCTFRSDINAQGNYEDESQSNEDRSAALEDVECDGHLVVRKGKSGRNIIECEHRHKGNSHLRLSDLDEYNTEYLSALFHNNTSVIQNFEEKARDNGYGPLMPCNFTVPASAKRQNCTEWHRFGDGRLDRGELHRDLKCSTVFHIFTPYDFSRCPYVLIVCHNPHSHPSPAPATTPKVYSLILKKLLLGLDWKLADATPRSILLDSGFMSGLRSELGWSDTRDPTLSNLHPSYINVDHIKRTILELRDTFFPFGTGYPGVEDLHSKHEELPLEDRYVRLIEEVNLSGNKKCHIIICMTASMSRHLMSATRITSDTSFKRVYQVEEFEFEVWQDNAKRSLVVCRAFITSQSSEAHAELFKRIFAIAERDTGIPVRFRYIHGEGFEIWVSDSHKGQALGLGLFLQWLCEGIQRPCLYEPTRMLSELDPYEHLLRILRLCIVHFKRHINDMRSYVSTEVINAMLSLATTENIANLNEVFAMIRSGGKKPSDWLDDKLTGSKFAFPALYWHASKIPLDIWRASPSTTNGNEQAHRNINRDGVNLTLLAGVMRGLQYDVRACSGIEFTAKTGINVRDEIATHHYRLTRSVTRKVRRMLLRLRQEGKKARAISKKASSAKTLVKKTRKLRSERLLEKSKAIPTLLMISNSQVTQSVQDDLDDGIRADDFDSDAITSHIGEPSYSMIDTAFQPTLVSGRYSDDLPSQSIHTSIYTNATYPPGPSTTTHPFLTQAIPIDHSSSSTTQAPLAYPSLPSTYPRTSAAQSSRPFANNFNTLAPDITFIPYVPGSKGKRGRPRRS